MKKQILIIHGGMTFKNQRDYTRYLKTREISLTPKRRWHGDYLDKALGKKFEVVRPRMPLQDNAKYRDWKVHFERYLPYLRGGYILIGISLGGIFLAKYLSEKRLPRRSRGVYLVCPPYDNSVKGEDLVGGFKLHNDLSLLSQNTKRLCLFFSANDPVVPSLHAEKYRKKLPDARIVVFKNKNGHFLISSFPEIVADIQALN